MDEQLVFALRVAASSTAFMVYILLLQEAIIRAAKRRFDLAFFLALSCSGMMLGMFAALSWHAVYVYTMLSSGEGAWMLTSPFIAAYIALIILSAVALMHSLTLSKKRTLACFSVIVGSGVLSYLWVGGIL